MKKEDFKPVSLWAEILEHFAAICPSVSGTLNGSAAYENQGFMLIYTQNEFFIKLLRKKENAEKLQEAVRRVTGRAYSIRAKYAGEAAAAASQSNENDNQNQLKSLLDKAAENGIPTEVK